MALPVPNEYKGQRLTDVQIASWAKGAGFPDDQIATAVAVALAESSGRIDAIGGPNVNGSFDYGLWQINEKAHPEKFKHWTNWWSSENSEMALAVYREAGNRWTPWSAFNSGAYRLYLPRGEAAAPQATTSARPDNSGEGATKNVFAIPDALNELGNAVKAIAGAFAKAGQWMGESQNWVRVAEVGIGAGLLIAALTIVARPAVQQIAGPAAAVLTKGKVK